MWKLPRSFWSRRPRRRSRGPEPMPSLVISVRLHDGRYHGVGDWPPCPARLFQALVAGVGLQGPLQERHRHALEWLEGLPAPVIAAPRAWQSRRSFRMYVPNNDSDAIGGDPARMSLIRTATKAVRPWFFDAAVPFLYAWQFPRGPEEEHATTICCLAERLYQLGRGWDMAWAWGEVMDEAEMEGLLSRYPGEVFRPSEGTSPTVLAAPCAGSLESLERRFHAFHRRFAYRKAEKGIEVTLRQPPRPRFQPVRYEAPPHRELFELRDAADRNRLCAWPLERIATLAVEARDAAVRKLRDAMSQRKADVDRVLIGRRPDGSNEYPPEKRVRILPLPSIGHPHADHEIRRILVETPAGCLLAPEDVRWAFSGLSVAEPGGAVAILVRSSNDSSLKYFGIGGKQAYRLWRSVTPAALPRASRGGKTRAEPTTAEARRERLESLAEAVLHALRHAGHRVPVEWIRIQREPFASHSRLSSDFAEHSRFHADELWHVEICFREPVQGPIVLGNGRFLGLGLMVPVAQTPEVHVFQITGGLSADAPTEMVSESLRRAVMALAGEEYRNGLPSYFSGHEPDGSPARNPGKPHLAFCMDPGRARLLVLAPSLLERRRPTPEEKKHLEVLDRKIRELTEIRAGKAGRLSVSPARIFASSDPLFRHSAEWCSATPYLVTRHYRCGDAGEAIRRDVQGQIRAHGLPEASIEVEEFWS
ncbi:MAG: type I-U CRISPR-associated protein Csb2, partial [Phycisphaerales bacterium]|nr:type I-U CRISPR-associated protein Csb2 [Phycisphaerales bacterium]